MAIVIECDLGLLRCPRATAVFARASYNLLRVAGRRGGLRGDRQTPQVRVLAQNRKSQLLTGWGHCQLHVLAGAHGHLLWDADGRTVSGDFHAPDVQSAAPVRREINMSS